MFSKRIKLFKLFGFQVSLDLSWFLILALITWSLASGAFPAYFPNLSTLTYWIMGFVGALGLFASVLVHEFSHSLVANKNGMPMHGITLFVFGGVAEMQDEPPSPRVEFRMAGVGPLVSVVTGGVFYGLSWAAQQAGASASIWGVLRYLGIINWALAVFNMIPAFPLDGGRVLRSLVWRSEKHDLISATRITSTIGRVFGYVLMGFGVFSLFMGNFIGGMWWFIIGIFLNNAARSSYQQVYIRKYLEGQKVSRFMKRNPVTVPPSISIRELVEEYVYQYHYKMFPVSSNGELEGCVTTKALSDIDKEQWDSRTVGEIASKCGKENTVSPDTEAHVVLRRMRKNGQSRMMVTENGKLTGIITLKDLLEYVSTKSELERE
jgi:Zn-dependent protease